MEEKMKLPGGFFDKDNLLVDKEIVDPFAEVQLVDEIYSYLFVDSSTNKKGYVHYKLQGKTVVILHCVYGG